MDLLVPALAGLKWLLFSVVTVLGFGKVLARVIQWIVNNACQVWLQRRPVHFSVANVGYRLRTCRLGVVEIDLLSGWLRSQGRLPCLGVVVGGLELRVEAVFPEEWDGDNGADTAGNAESPSPKPARSTSFPPPDVEEGILPLLISSLWARLVSKVLKQCAISLFGIRVVLNFPGSQMQGVKSRSNPRRLATRRRGVGGGGGGVGGGGDDMSAELCLSCVEAFAKPLERGKAGIRLVLRAEQDTQQYFLFSSLGTADGINIGADIDLEVDLVTAPRRHLATMSHMISAVRITSTAIRGVIREGDIKAMESWMSRVATFRRGTSATNTTTVLKTRDFTSRKEQTRSGLIVDDHGRVAATMFPSAVAVDDDDANEVDRGEEVGGRCATCGIGAQARDPIWSLPFLTMLSPSVSFEAAFDAIRVDVVGNDHVEDSDVGSTATTGYLGSAGAEGDGWDIPGAADVLRDSVDSANDGRCGDKAGVCQSNGSADSPATAIDKHGTQQNRIRGVQWGGRHQILGRRRRTAPSVVADVKGFQMHTKITSSEDGSYSPGHGLDTKKVNFAVKWSSVVVAVGSRGKGGNDAQNDDGDGGGRHHSRSASSVSFSTGGGLIPPTPDREAKRAAAFKGIKMLSARKESGLETADLWNKWRSLPVHMGRLSFSAEAGMNGNSTVLKVVASGRLSFGRFTLSRDGLSTLLWLVNLGPTLLQTAPSTSRPMRETTSRGVRAHSNVHRGSAGSPSGTSDWASSGDAGAEQTMSTSTPPPNVWSPRQANHSKPSRRRSGGPISDGDRQGRYLDLQISYTVSFEVDRVGVVIARDDGDDGDMNLLYAECPRADSRRNAVGQKTATRSSTRGSTTHHAQMSPHSPRSGEMENAQGDDLDAGLSAATHHREAVSLIRLSVPRVVIRAGSMPSLKTTVPPSSDSGGMGVDTAVNGGNQGDDRRVGSKRAERNASRLGITITAESVEGHLEMDDPGRDVVPLSPPTLIQVPCVPPLSPFDGVEERDGSRRATPPRFNLSHTLPPHALSEKNADTATLPKGGGFPPLSFDAVDESYEPFSEKPTTSSAKVQATMLQETHCLRWLAIRKVSFKTGASGDAEPTSIQGASGKVSTRARNVSGVNPAGSSGALHHTPGTEEATGDIGLAVEGLWAEWSPVLFFLAGKSGAMIVSCLKDAGFLSTPNDNSGLGYNPLQQWSPPPPTSVSPPPNEPPPPFGTPSGRQEKSSEPRAAASDPRGPSLGFPGDRLGLPRIGETSRTTACFANQVFTKSSTSSPAAVDLLWRSSEKWKEHTDSDGGSRCPGGKASDDGFRRRGNREGGSGGQHNEPTGGMGTGRVVIPQIFALSVRDVRVEFPFQASVCAGDMEYEDIVQWLRRFRGSVLSGEGTGVTQGVTSDTLNDSLSRNVALKEEAKGGLERPLGVHTPKQEGKAGVRFSRRRSTPITVAGCQTASFHPPPPGPVPWACQYVEAQEFDLCTAVSGGANEGEGSDDVGGVGRILPRLNCAISGVSVSTAEYTHNRNDFLGLLHKCSSDPETRKTESSPTAAASQATPFTVNKAKTSGAMGWNAAGGEYYSGPTGRCGSGQKGLPRSLSVSMGGTRHFPKSRKRILRVSKFAVLQMCSSDKNEDRGEVACTVPGSRVVDILAEGVEGNWTPATHLKIMKPVSEVTLSIWKAMLHLRRAWLHLSLPRSLDGGIGDSGAFLRSADRSPPWDDPVALDYWVRAWLAGGPSGPAGDTLHRLHVRDVALRGRWPAQRRWLRADDETVSKSYSSSGSFYSSSPSSSSSSTSSPGRASSARRQRASPRPVFPAVEEYGIRMDIRVGEFSSESVGEHFRFLRTAVDLDGSNLAFVSTCNLTRTLGETRSVNLPRHNPAGAAVDTDDAVQGSRKEGENIGEASASSGAGVGAAGEEPEVKTPQPLPPPTNPSERRIVGACFHELKARAMAVAAARTAAAEKGEYGGNLNANVTSHGDHPVNRERTGNGPSIFADAVGVRDVGSGVNVARALEQWLLPLVTRPAGFLVEVEGAVVRAQHGRALGKRLDSLVLQTKGLAVALAEMPCRWHPLKTGPCGDFHHLFWKPPIPEEAFVSSSSRPQDRAWGTHVWIRAKGVAFEITDEPLEAWFEAMHPVWSRQLATRVFRRALRERLCSSGSSRQVHGSSRSGKNVKAGVELGVEEAGSSAHERDVPTAFDLEHDDDEEDSRSYVEHVHETFGAHGPPSAFPLPGASAAAAAWEESTSSPAGGTEAEDGGGSTPTLVRVRVGNVYADVTPPSAGEGLCRGLLERLDQHPPPLGTKFGALASLNFSVRCTDLRARLRQFEQPLFTCEGVSAGGVAMAAWARAPHDDLTGVKYVVIDEKEAIRTAAANASAAASAAVAGYNSGLAALRMKQDAATGVAGRVAVVTRDLPPKAYLDLSVCIERPQFECSPAHAHSLADVARAAKLFLPSNMFPQVASGRREAVVRVGTQAGQGLGSGTAVVIPPLAWWDAGRCMVHGKFDATVFGGAALLVANAQSTPPSIRFPSREALAAAAGRSSGVGCSSKFTRGDPIPPADASSGSSAATSGRVGRTATMDLGPVVAAVGSGGSSSPGSNSLDACSGQRLSWKGGGARRKDLKGSAVNGSSATGGCAGVGERGRLASLGSLSPSLPGPGGGEGGMLGRRGSVGDSGGLGSARGGRFGLGAESNFGGSRGGLGGEKSDLKELQRRKALVVSCLVLRAGWTGAGRIALEVTGLGVEASPPPAPGLPPLLELPTLRCTIRLSWHTLGGPSPNHWVYLCPPQSSSAARRRGELSPGAPTSDHQQGGSTSTSPRGERGIPTPKSQTADKETAFLFTVMSGCATGKQVSGRLESAAEDGVGRDPGGPDGPKVQGDPAMDGGEDGQEDQSRAAQHDTSADPFELFRGRGVSFQVHATAPNRPTGGMLPPLHPSVTPPQSLVSELSCLPPRMSVSLFGCSLGWAVEWGTCFSKFPAVPIPGRKCKVPTSLGRPSGTGGGTSVDGSLGGCEMGARRTSSDASVFARLRREAEGALTPRMVTSERAFGPADDVDDDEKEQRASQGAGKQSEAAVPPAPEQLADLVRGFRLGPVFVSEVDVSAYNTTPADLSKRGVRLTVRGGVAAGLCFSVEKSGAINPFTTGRVVIPTTSLVVTTVHGLRLRAGKIEARLCDRDAGSRGNLFLRLRRVALAQGNGNTPAKIPSPKTKRSSRTQPGGGGCSRCDGTVRPTAAADSRWSEPSVAHGSSIGKETSVPESSPGQQEKHIDWDGDRGQLSTARQSPTSDSDASDGEDGFNADGMRGVEDSENSSDSNSYVGVGEGDEDDEDDDLADQFGFIEDFDDRADNGSSGFIINNYPVKGSTLPPPSPLSTSPLPHVSGGASFPSPDRDRTKLSKRYRSTAAAKGRSLTTPSARVKLSRRMWASRGGVPPSLELLPSHGRTREGILARLGESSADEAGMESVSDGSVEPRGSTPSPRATAAAASASQGMNVNVGGDEDWVAEAPTGTFATASSKVGIEGDDDNAAAAASTAAAHREVGSGRWDEHLQEITRAAWLRSKQASSRGFHSNASSNSVASASIASTPLSPGAAEVAASLAAGANNYPPPWNNSLSSSSGRSSHVISNFQGGEGAAPPTQPPQSLVSPSNAATVDPTAASTSPDVTAEDFGVFGSARSEIPGVGGRKSGGGEQGGDGSGRVRTEAAAVAADERVAGSGFLYRVVVDGLNILMTLKLRDSLLLLTQSGMEMALATLPGLSNPSKALLAKEREGEVLRGELHRRTSLDLRQFIDKPLALPGRRRDSGSLTPYSKAERQSEDSVDSLAIGGGGGRSTAAGAAGPQMHKLFSIELRRTQIQLLGSEAIRATLLFSMEQGVVQGWVGLDPEEEGALAAKLKQSDVVESYRLQCLAQRLLTTFREAVTVGLEGTMLSAAPTDVDVDAGVQWLPDSAFAPAPPPGPSPPAGRPSQRHSRRTPPTPSAQPPCQTGPLSSSTSTGAAATTGGGDGCHLNVESPEVDRDLQSHQQHQQGQHHQGIERRACTSPKGLPSESPKRLETPAIYPVIPVGNAQVGGGELGADGDACARGDSSSSAGAAQGTAVDSGVGVADARGYVGDSTASAATYLLSPTSAGTPDIQPAEALEVVRGGGIEDIPREISGSLARPSGVATAADSKIPFFGSGEWAAGGFPGHRLPAVGAALSAMAAKATAGGACTEPRFGIAGVDLPDSPQSACSGSTVGGIGGGGRSSGVGACWGPEAVSGKAQEESPSRAKERAARNSLMREAGVSGVTSVFSGGAVGGVSLGTAMGPGATDHDDFSRNFSEAARVAPTSLRRGSLLSGERTVFKPVVNRIDSLELQVLAHHGAVENSVVKIDLPTIQAALNSLQLKLVATVVSEVLASPVPPMLTILKPSKGGSGAGGRGVDASTSAGGRRGPSSNDGGNMPEGMGGGGGVGRANGMAGGGPHDRDWRGLCMGLGMFPPPTVASSWASQRQADWETRELRRLRHCISEAWQGLNPSSSFPVSEGPRASPTGEGLPFSPGVVLSPRREDGGLSDPQHQRHQHQHSDREVKGRERGALLLEWAKVVDEEALASSRRSVSASQLLRKAVRLLKQKLQQRPNTHLALHLKRLKLELWRDESSTPFLRAEIRRVTADVMVYDDSSGSVDLQLGSLWASQVRGYSNTNAAAEVAHAAPPPPSSPPLPPRGTLQDKPCGAATPVPAAGAGERDDEDSSEWWRAGDCGGPAGVGLDGGGGGGGPRRGRGAGGSGKQHALMALEVVKPLMAQDLERLSDQGNLRGWSPREITVHVQAQLGSPIGEMTLVRHFEAAVFPLVLHLRRSLFADLSAFSSEAVAALSATGANRPDSGTTQRDEQIKASFLTSRKAKTKAGRRLRPSWIGKGSSAAALTPGTGAGSVTDMSTGGRRTRTKSVGGSGSGSIVGHSTTWDSASDAGDAVADDLIESGHLQAPESSTSTSVSALASKDEAAARETEEAGIMARPLAVKHLRLGEVNVFLTYMGDRYLELEDVDNVHLKLHPLVYTNKTWTPRKLLFRMRRDVILDVLSQVSRNFSNLGNFLNTRLLKSGVTTAGASSNSTGASSATRSLGADGHGGSSSSRRNSAAADSAIGGVNLGADGRSDKQSTPRSTAATGAVKRGIRRGLSSDFLPDPFSATSRSVSPPVRPIRALSLKGRKFLPTRTSFTGGSAEAETEAGFSGSPTAQPAVTPTRDGGVGGGPKQRMGWKGFRTPLSRRAGAGTSPLPRMNSEDVSDGSDHEGDSDDNSGKDDAESPITIGPAAAAAAAAAEAARARNLSDIQFSGGDGTATTATDHLTNTEAMQSKADEHDAKLLLFGRQLGGGVGRGRARPAGNTSGGKSSLLPMSLPQRIKRMTLPGKKGASGLPGARGGGNAEEDSG